MNFFNRNKTAVVEPTFDAPTSAVEDLTGDYTIDPAHTRLGFSARHAMVTTVRGQFKEFAGTAHIDADNPWRSLWNGAALPVRRIQAGALAGHVGIGLLQLLALRGLGRTVHAGPERRIAGASAAGASGAGAGSDTTGARLLTAVGSTTSFTSRGPTAK